MKIFCPMCDNQKELPPDHDEWVECDSCGSRTPIQDWKITLRTLNSRVFEVFVGSGLRE